MLIPLLVYGVTVHFTITLTIRETAMVVFSEDVDLDKLSEILDKFSWQAIDVSSVSLNSSTTTPPIVVMTDEKLTASNADNNEVAVVTFTARNTQSDRIEYIVGGYIASNAGSRRGTYHGSTEYTVMFQ